MRPFLKLCFGSKPNLKGPLHDHRNAQHRTSSRTPRLFWYVGVAVGGVVWLLLYQQLIPFSEWATALFPVARDSHTGEAIAFFLYDVPKVLLLLTIIVFVTGVL